MVPCAQGSPGCVTGSYGYKAAPGYDLATGLGSVDGYNFVTQWNTPANAVNVAVFANVSPATLNDTVVFTATVSAASGSGIPTGTVEFSAGTTALGSAPLAASGGAATANITVPAWLVGGGSGPLASGNPSPPGTDSAAPESRTSPEPPPKCPR